MIDPEQEIIDEMKREFGKRSRWGTDHPERKPDCPRTWRIPEGVAKGWGDEYRRHVAGCPFCKKVSAMQWNVAPPDGPAIWRHLEDGTAPDDADLRRSLDEERYLQYGPLMRRLRNLPRPLAEAVGQLATLANDPDEIVRVVAVCALRKTGTPNAREVLRFVAARSDEAARVRALAAKAIAIMSPPARRPEPPYEGGPVGWHVPAGVFALRELSGGHEGEESHVTWAIRTPAVTADGRNQEVNLEILPTVGPDPLKPLIPDFFYLSVNDRIVVTLRIRRPAFPGAVAGGLCVSAVTVDTSIVPSHDSTARLRPDEPCLFEFAIPSNLRQDWCNSPAFLLTAVEAGD